MMIYLSGTNLFIDNKSTIQPMNERHVWGNGRASLVQKAKRPKGQRPKTKAMGHGVCDLYGSHGSLSPKQQQVHALTKSYQDP